MGATSTSERIDGTTRPTPLAQALGIATRGRRTSLLVLLSLALGACHVVHLFGWDYLTGASRHWAAPTGLIAPAGIESGFHQVDVAEAISGYFYFIQDGWRVPLFDVARLGAPDGSSVLFTDSVPIAALLGRLASRLAGHPVNLLGLWRAGSYVLLGVGMTVLVARLGGRSILAGVAATALGLWMPVLLFRWGHLSLNGQFDIVFCLVLHFSRHRLRGIAFPAAAGGLAILALVTHPYIFAMCICLIVATSVQRILDGDIAPARGWFDLAVVTGLAAIALWGAGFTGGASSFAASGLGVFSWNPVSPLVPQMTGLWPAAANFVVDHTGGQYEGFSYLGAGVLLLLAATACGAVSDGAARTASAAASAWRREPCLVVSLAAMALFALSPRVTFGSWDIAAIPLPAALRHAAGVFRATGRFVWPLVYLVTALAVAGAVRRHRRGSAVLLAAAILLQWVDTAPLRHGVAASAASEGHVPFDADAWRHAVAAHTAVLVAPTVDCFPNTPRRAERVLQLRIQLYASLVNAATNSVYSSRPRVDCGSARRALPASAVVAGTLRVYFAQSDEFARLASGGGTLPRGCVGSAALIVCSPVLSEAALRPLLVMDDTAGASFPDFPTDIRPPRPAPAS